jgi:hypothetical protein
MRAILLVLVSVSSLSAALSSPATCKLPIPSVPYTSGIPSWQSDNYACQGPPDVFVVRSSPGKGLGVFALHDLEIGDIVMRETPALKIDPPDFVRGTGYPMDKVAKLVRKEFEALSIEQQEDIMSLTYHATADEEATMDKLGIIFRTNAYNTDQQIGLFPKIARINHSCRPNTSYYWNSKLNKRVVYANRQIKRGEEFSVSYIGLLSGHQDRQGSLDRYGFQCSCEACAQHDAAKQASGRRRVEIHRGFAEFEPKLTLAVPQSKSAQKQAAKNARASIELAELVESEGLADYYAKVYRIVAISHARIQKWEAATMWANKGYQLKYMEDPESPYTIEMHQLAGSFIQEWENELRNKSG